jgi:sulfoxide reductase heme-binding subunit YedZ
LRHRIGRRTWRGLHWLAYACWPVALLHGLGTGTDSGTLWLRGLAVACSATVLAALAWRTSDRFDRTPETSLRAAAPMAGALR